MDIFGQLVIKKGQAVSSADVTSVVFPGSGLSHVLGRYEMSSSTLPVDTSVHKV